MDVSSDANWLKDVMPVISIFSANCSRRRRYKRREEEDPEGEDVSESESEEDAEEVVGGESIPLQQGASKSQRGRRTKIWKAQECSAQQ